MAERRVFVLGLDGVPWTLARRFADEGVMPNLGRLLGGGGAAQIDSVYPTVSNVAWSCFQTGKNPGRFDIFGFAEIDRRLQLRLPNGEHLLSETIEQVVSAAGGRVISLGLPSGHPPRAINGLMVGGFLAPSLERTVHPPGRLEELRRLGWQLDVDPVRARTDRDYLQRAAMELLAGRRRTADAMLAEPWDLFLLHVMETDRVNHFLWGQWADGGPAAAFFRDFYRGVDDWLGRLDAALGDDVTLIVLSDHGFCRITAEVQLNRWLRREGCLWTAGPPERMFQAVAPPSRAVSLVPGRVHLLRREAFDVGTLEPDEAAALRDELADKLRRWTDPASGAPVCARLLRREETFAGPYVHHAPDLLIDPADGYDLKAALSDGELFDHSPLEGMHTYRDAMLCIRGRAVTPERRGITDVTRSILDLLGVPAGGDLDSRGVLA